jgi:hypothetical protein
MKKLATYFLFLSFFAFMACDESRKGYTPLSGGVYKKLLAFDEHGKKLGASDHAALYIHLRNSKDSTVYNDFVMYTGLWKNLTDSLPNADSSLLRDMSQLESGQRVSYLLPHSMVRNTFIDGFIGDSLPAETELELVFGVLETFTHEEFLQFLTLEAQSGKISEMDAIDFAFINKPDSLELKGDIAFQWHKRTEGQKAASGQEITIRYGTELLDGTVLDTLSEMTFTFGKPGQIVPGLGYAINHMHRGEVADVYMPSYLAFGEYGSSTGLVPAFTPVKFRVELVADSMVTLSSTTPAK